MAAPDDPEVVLTKMRKLNLRSVFQSIAAHPKLRRMASLIMITGIAETVMLYLFYWLISEKVPIINGRGLFFANFYLWLNGWTLLLLILGANRLINRFGLIFALVSMPVALFLGSTYLIVQTVLVSMYVLRISYSAMEQSLYGQGLDRLILDVDERHAPLVRPVLHGLAGRIGQGIGAVIVIVLALGIGISFTHMMVVFMIVLLGWIAVAISLRPYLSKSSLLSPPAPPLASAD